MELLYTIFLIILIAISPIIGFLIAKYTKEEQKYAKPYIRFAFKVIFIALFVLVFILNRSNFYLFLLSFILGVIFSFFIRDYIFYFGIVFFSVLNNSQSIIFLSSVFIFLLNLIFGIVYYNSNQRLKDIKKHILLFLIPIILYLSNIGNSFDTNLIAPFGLGGIRLLMLNQKSNKLKPHSKKKR